MTRDEIITVNRDRLGRWLRRLSGEHATAIVLVGVGHDDLQGDLVVCAVEANDDGVPSNQDLAELLRGAARELEAMR